MTGSTPTTRRRGPATNPVATTTSPPPQPKRAKTASTTTAAAASTTSTPAATAAAVSTRRRKRGEGEPIVEEVEEEQTHQNQPQQQQTHDHDGGVGGVEDPDAFEDYDEEYEGYEGHEAGFSSASAASSSAMPLPPHNAAASDKEKAVPAFLYKLQKMVDDPSIQEHISWSESGKSFIVHRQVEFAQAVLPRFFKHNNLASFVRQLNMYGFTKVMKTESGLHAESNGALEFENKYFVKDRPDLLPLVKRRNATAEAKAVAVPVPASVDIEKILRELQGIKQHQAAITSNLKNIQRDNQVLWNEMMTSRQRYQKQQQTTFKILQFLASLYGVTRDGQGIRQGGRLLLSDGAQKPQYQDPTIRQQVVELLNADQEDPLDPPVPHSPGPAGLKDDIDHLQKNISSLLDNDFFSQFGGVEFPEFDLEQEGEGGAFLKEVEETPGHTDIHEFIS